MGMLTKLIILVEFLGEELIVNWADKNTCVSIWLLFILSALKMLIWVIRSELCQLGYWTSWLYVL